MAACDSYHVTSIRNRDSINRYGLDWRKMGTVPGIAGSLEPEVEGIFLALGAYECRHFASLSNSGDPIDIWQVYGINLDALRTSHNGYLFFPGAIGPDRLSLVATDIARGDAFNLPDQDEK